MKTIRVTARVPKVSDESLEAIVGPATVATALVTLLVLFKAVDGWVGLGISLLFVGIRAFVVLRGPTPDPAPPSPQPWVNKSCAFFPESFKEPPKKNP